MLIRIGLVFESGSNFKGDRIDPREVLSGLCQVFVCDLLAIDRSPVSSDLDLRFGSHRSIQTGTLN